MADSAQARLSGRPRAVPLLLCKCQVGRQPRHDQAAGAARAVPAYRPAASNRLESMSALACFSPA